jgi:hypothetical protein
MFRRQRLIPTLFAVLLLCGSSASVFAPNAGAQDGRPDPTLYLPSQLELPVGFSPKPEQNKDQSFEAGAMAIRQYARPSPSNAQGAAMLQIIAGSFNSTPLAQQFFQITLESFQSQGW